MSQLGHERRFWAFPRRSAQSPKAAIKADVCGRRRSAMTRHRAFRPRPASSRQLALARYKEREPASRWLGVGIHLRYRSSSCGVGWRLRASEPGAATLTQGLECDIEHWDHKQPDRASRDHAGEYRRADIVPADLGSALCDDQRIDPENEGEGGHHHCTKPHPRAQNRRFPDIHSLLALVLGEFDDEDA